MIMVIFRWEHSDRGHFNQVPVRFSLSAVPVISVLLFLRVFGINRYSDIWRIKIKDNRAKGWILTCRFASTLASIRTRERNFKNISRSGSFPTSYLDVN